MTNPIIEIVRSSIRPIISVIFAAVMAQAVIDGISLPEWFLGLAIPCISWWFVERTLTHYKGK